MSDPTDGVGAESSAGARRAAGETWVDPEGLVIDLSDPHGCFDCRLLGTWCDTCLLELREEASRWLRDVADLHYQGSSEDERHPPARIAIRPWEIHIIEVPEPSSRGTGGAPADGWSANPPPGYRIDAPQRYRPEAPPEPFANERYVT